MEHFRKQAKGLIPIQTFDFVDKEEDKKLKTGYEGVKHAIVTSAADGKEVEKDKDYSCEKRKQTESIF